MEKGKKLHIVMLPWLAYGHITPFFELSKRLAQKGHSVSFISTPRNVDRLPKIPQQLTSLINLVKLSFPQNSVVDGLPPGTESMSDISSSKAAFLIKTYQGLEEPITKFLEASSPDWIVYDSFAPFVPKMLANVASKHNITIRQAWLVVTSANGFCLMEPLKTTGDVVPRNLEDFLEPPSWIPFPNKLAYRLYEFLDIIDQHTSNPNVGGNIMEDARTLLRACDALLIHSCLELEDDYFKLLQELHGKHVLPTGFLTPSIQEVVSRENHDEEGWQFIKKWLDKQRKGSVVYIALGSEVSPTQQMLDELALGLELSNLPFLWALRKPKAGEVILKLPDRFEDRTRNRGLIWRSWAPQLLILEQDSIGGFICHCGWNSTLEALQFGKPLITLPFFGDQGITARFYEDKQLGIGIPRDEQDGSITRNAVAETLRLVIDEEAGKIYRDKAKEAREILGDRNLHMQYTDRLEEFLCSYESYKKTA
ncbi:putative UDP-rhamnose:rhamnosyltransferase 1 [Drosera capensis]